MKTPDEIKKGLECCKNGLCVDCPYVGGECGENKNGDAIAYIRQLEGERDEALELIGKLIVILKKYPNAATNGCAYGAYKEIQKYLLNLRGACK